MPEILTQHPEIVIRGLIASGWKKTKRPQILKDCKGTILYYKTNKTFYELCVYGVHQKNALKQFTCK